MSAKNIKEGIAAMLKKFLLFTGRDFYPEGGAVDYYCSFDKLEDATCLAREMLTRPDSIQWANVIDTEEEVMYKLAWNGRRKNGGTYSLVKERLPPNLGH